MDKEARLKALDMVIKKAQAQRRTPVNITPAYIQGFCKSAEDAGIDPEELMKMANWWDDTKEGLSTTWGTIKALPGELYDQVTDGTMVKNLGTGAGRLATGIGQGLANVASGVGGLIGGIGGAIGSGLSGNGWGNGWSSGWDAGSKFVDDIGPGDYNIGAAKRRMGAWQNQLRDDYLERNNIDPSDPASMNWADKVALLGSDITEGAGKALGETIAINGLASGIGGLFGSVGRSYAGSSDLFGKGMSMFGNGVNRLANFAKQTGPIGPKTSLFWTGVTLNRALDATGNYNRQYQDFWGSGNSNNTQAYYNAVTPGDISNLITYNV